MNIDWNAFSPISAAIGGVLIGIASVALMSINGRIAGISGILAGIFTPRSPDTPWRMAFLLGLLLAPLAYRWLVPAPLPTPTIDASYPTLVVAGLLVGVGTRYGAGCTSGHGICGLSRLSVRSLIATLCFMLAGFAVVALIRLA
jgi:uncharacterized membrane protein YedE/YeeE